MFSNNKGHMSNVFEIVTYDGLMSSFEALSGTRTVTDNLNLLTIFKRNELFKFLLQNGLKINVEMGEAVRFSNGTFGRDQGRGFKNCFRQFGWTAMIFFCVLRSLY